MLGSFMARVCVCVESLGESYSDFATWAAYQVPPRVYVCVCVFFIYLRLYLFISVSPSSCFALPSVCLL